MRQPKPHVELLFPIAPAGLCSSPALSRSTKSATPSPLVETDDLSRATWRAAGKSFLHQHSRRSVQGGKKASMSSMRAKMGAPASINLDIWTRPEAGMAMSIPTLSRAVPVPCGPTRSVAEVIRPFRLEASKEGLPVDAKCGRYRTCTVQYCK